MYNDFNESKTLIVVCKDELFINQLKKYVETNEKSKDNHEKKDRIKINIVAWDEKVWLDNKKTGNLASKILLIGNVKGDDKLIPIIDVKYNKFGIKYGWAGNQALLIVNPKVLSNETNYDAFFEEFQKTSALQTYLQLLTLEQEQREKKKKRKKIVKIIHSFLDPVGSLTVTLIQIGVKCFGNKEMIEKQQFLFGITKLYENHLDEFLEK